MHAESSWMCKFYIYKTFLKKEQKNLQQEVCASMPGHHILKASSRFNLLVALHPSIYGQLGVHQKQKG
jgi:hypothetical protein